MELVPIFVGESHQDSGLWAVRYSEDPDEFERLFDLWHDTEYLETFFRNNIHDLPRDFASSHEDIIHEAVESTMDEADELEDALLTFVKGGFAQNGQNLQQIFQPLDNRVYELRTLQKSKASVKSRWRPSPKLRIYAIRLAPNLYIITGGAIKLTHTMNERPHLVEELQKIEQVRQWLQQKGISEPEDINDQV